MPSIFNQTDYSDREGKALVVPQPPEAPYSPALKYCLLNAASGITLSTSELLLTWSETVDAQGWFNPAVPGQLQVTEAGLYRASFNIITGTWTGTLNNMRVWVVDASGSMLPIIDARTISTDGYDFRLSGVSRPVSLAVGSFITIMARLTTSSTGIEVASWFCLEKVG
jgi:hypothetical protein